MNDRKYPKRIERMIDVMLCIPKSAWGLVLEKVEKKIGAAALRTIILRAYEADLKRGVVMLDREKKGTEQEQKEKQKAPQRHKRA